MWFAFSYTKTEESIWGNQDMATLFKWLVGAKKGWFHQNNEKDEDAFPFLQDKPAYTQEFNNTGSPLSSHLFLGQIKHIFLPTCLLP